MKNFFGKITPLQWAVLVALVFANLIVLIVFVFAVISSNASADIPQPAIVKVITATVTRTPASTPTRTSTPVLTATPSLTVTPSLTRAPTNTPIPLTPSRTPTSVSTATLPPQARLLNVAGSQQALALSCEAHIAIVIAAHYGVQINEIEFFKRLPTSDNPEAGFVGDVNGGWGQIPPDPYGVHAEPIAALLREYNVPVTAWKDLTLNDLRAEIVAGRPVGIWVTGHVSSGEPLTYITAAGDKVIVARYEHTVIVIGYTQDSFLILDGTDTYYRSIDQFSQSWRVLGNMAILRGR